MLEVFSDVFFKIICLLWFACEFLSRAQAIVLLVSLFAAHKNINPYDPTSDLSGQFVLASRLDGLGFSNLSKNSGSHPNPDLIG